MAFEIFSVPFAYNTNGEWNLNTQCLDLRNQNLPFHQDFPISQIPLLPIGARIEDDLNIASNNRIKKIYNIGDFNTGKIMTLSDFDEGIFHQDLLNNEVLKTKFYVFDIDGRQLVFYCYEIFRAFLCNNNSLINYLFQYDLLENFIDRKEVYKRNNLECLDLFLGENFPIRHTRSKNFMERLILLLFNPDLRSYWKNIQANENNGINDFEFTSFPLKNIKIVARIKEYKDFDLVLHIDSIPSRINFPFHIINIHHPKFRASPSGRLNQSRSSSPDSEPKNVNAKINVPKSNDFNKGSTKESRSSSEIAVLPLTLLFNKKIEISKKRPENDKEARAKRKSILMSFKLKDIKLGLGGLDHESSTEFLELIREESFNRFNYEIIPKGLVPFCKSIEILSKTLKIDFEFELLEFSEKSPFHKISNPIDQLRKALKIEIKNNPSIFLCEIDSSDDKYISTLAITDLMASNTKKFFNELLELASLKNGSWPDEYLDKFCTHITIKHPKKIKIEENTLEDSEEYNIYIERLSSRLINTLT